MPSVCYPVYVSLSLRQNIKRRWDRPVRLGVNLDPCERLGDRGTRNIHRSNGVHAAPGHANHGKQRVRKAPNAHDLQRSGSGTPGR